MQASPLAVFMKKLTSSTADGDLQITIECDNAKASYGVSSIRRDEHYSGPRRYCSMPVMNGSRLGARATSTWCPKLDSRRSLRKSNTLFLQRRNSMNSYTHSRWGEPLSNANHSNAKWYLEEDTLIKSPKELLESCCGDRRSLPCPRRRDSLDDSLDVFEVCDMLESSDSIDGEQVFSPSLAQTHRDLGFHHDTAAFLALQASKIVESRSASQPLHQSNGSVMAQSKLFPSVPKRRSSVECDDSFMLAVFREKSNQF